MQFEITSHSGESVRIDSPNWMMAMGKAMPFFDMDPSSMGRWVCDTRPDGTVSVEDPVARTGWTIREHQTQVRVVASAASIALAVEDAPPAQKAPEPRFDPSVPPPSLTMPLQSTLERQAPPPAPAPVVEEEEEPESLGERLFELSMDISGARPPEAARLALELLLEFVECEAASIVRGTLNDAALTFLAASGPVGHKIIGRKIPFGQGIVGMCFDLGIPVEVREPSADDKFHGAVDSDTGFSTDSILACPIVSDTGDVVGVVEVLNPPDAFQRWEIEAVETIARTLVAPLSA